MFFKKEISNIRRKNNLATQNSNVKDKVVLQILKSTAQQIYNIKKELSQHRHSPEKNWNGKVFNRKWLHFLMNESKIGIKLSCTHHRQLTVNDCRWYCLYYSKMYIMQGHQCRFRSIFGDSEPFFHHTPILKQKRLHAKQGAGKEKARNKITNKLFMLLSYVYLFETSSCDISYSHAL